MSHFRSHIGGSVALICALALAGSTIAAQLKEATISQIIRQVDLLPTGAAAKPAALHDNVRDGTAVRTGAESRTELTFTDQTLARLGANTIFSFNEGTRNLDLGGGAMLLAVPKGAGGARISTAAVTAAVTGTTVIIEYHPSKPAPAETTSANQKERGFLFGLITRKPRPPKAEGGYIKFITLEGVARVYLNNRIGESVLVPAGKMLIVSPDATHMPDPVDVDLERLLKTSLLIIDFPPLVSQQLIVNEARKQKALKAQGKLIDTNLVIYGRGTLVSLEDSPPFDPITQAIDAMSLAGAAGAGGFGPEIGPLKTITSPNPYVVNSGTTIKTAPTITTAGLTQQGRLYRGIALDGFAAQYLFGSTSAFDTSSTFAEKLEQAANLPLAVFKFSNLQLAGNPTITVPAGGATNLAFISAGNITDAAPGGPLTFAGMQNVTIATQAASMTLDANISFNSIPSLTLYARGAGSNLTIGSPVAGSTGNISLLGEGSVTVNGNEDVGGFFADAGVDYLGGTGKITSNAILIDAGNNLNFATVNFATHAGIFPSVILNAGGTISFDIRTDQSILKSAGKVSVNGKTINVTADPGGTTLGFNPAAQVMFAAGAGGLNALETTFLQGGNTMEFSSNADIVVNSIVAADSISAQGSVHSTSTLVANTITASGSPTSDITSGADVTGIVSITAGRNIGVAGTLLSPNVTAGGDINVGHLEAQNVNPGVLTSNTTLMAGGGGITPFVGPSGSALKHTFNVRTVVSPNGIDFNGSHFGSGANGGILTINAQSQLIGAGGIAGLNFDGAPVDAVSPTPGNGGSFTLNTSSDLVVNGATMFEATTGIIPTNAPAPLGAGGSVSLTSTNGGVAINNSRIQVSSNDPAGTANRHSSASGGTIAIESDRPNSVAIQISNSSQLLSLLENAAPGPGGLITLKATGVASSISVSGTIQADGAGASAHGVDIRHAGDAGTITLNNATVHGDIVKAAVLGTNGVLSIGGGMLTANSILKLYAPGSNGMLVFVANCTIGGGSATILAANTVQINNGVVVNVTGHAADVFVTFTAAGPNANYSGFGGNGSTNGMFTGLGANNPQPLANAPPLGAPGGP